MQWSINLGKIAGTAIRIHITFILFLLLIVIVAYRANGLEFALDTFAFISSIFICVILHEFGHILVAHRFGIETQDVTLFPIGGVASMKLTPEKPSQELLVALAGPFVNLIIAISLLLILRRTITINDLSQLDNVETSFALRLAVANLALMAFNMLPAFPMDGGRVLRALLAIRLGKSQATRIAAVIGQGFAFLLGFLGFFGNPMLIFIAFFIFIAAGAEADTAALHDAAGELSVSDAMITSMTFLLPSDSIGTTIEKLLHSTNSDFPVTDEHGKALGLVARSDVLQIIGSSTDGTPITSIMRPINVVIGETDSLEKALAALETSGASALLVTDKGGQITGLITRAAIAQVILIRTAKPGWSFHHRDVPSITLPTVNHDRQAASSSPSP
jgi:Zn-dependent protease